MAKEAACGQRRRRPSDEIRHNLLVRIARLYYLCHMTHQRIADQEGMSRIKITRLLKEAVDKRIVEFNIKDPIVQQLELEEVLQTTFGLKTVTTPYGNVENTFDICRLGEAAGATFVARWTTYHARQVTNTIKKMLQKKGFSLLEVFSQCPVQFGRRTGIGGTVKMLEMYRKQSVRFEKARTMSPEELEGKIVVGEFLNIEKPVLTDEIEKQRRAVLERLG